MKYYKTMNSPLGILTLIEEDGFLTNIYFDRDIFSLENIEKKDTTVLNETCLQLNEYFDKKREKFDILLKPKGTLFQCKVWKELLNIKYGELKTYKDIAELIKCPKGYRAVGLANNKNPIPIIIPCHRVIGTNKKLVGYSSGIDIKKYLILLESSNDRGSKK